MSMIVKAVFDSEDFADYAAARVKHRVPGFIDAKVRKYRSPDEEEERPLGIIPVVTPYFNSAYTAPVVYAAFNGLNLTAGDMNRNAPDVMLELICEDDAYKQVESILRSFGGREIMSEPAKK